MNSTPKELGFFHPDPDQPRKDFDLEDLCRLATSLQKKQHVPVIARKNGTLVDGERRWRAASLNGKPTHLEAILLDDSVTEAEVRSIQLVIALHRADLKPWELYCGCVEWRKHHPDATARELAQEIDFTESYLTKVLSLDKGIPAVKDAAREGKLGVGDWYVITQAPAAEQAALLAAKLNGATRADLQAQAPPATRRRGAGEQHQDGTGRRHSGRRQGRFPRPRPGH